MLLTCNFLCTLCVMKNMGYVTLELYGHSFQDNAKRVMLYNAKEPSMQKNFE